VTALFAQQAACPSNKMASRLSSRKLRFNEALQQIGQEAGLLKSAGDKGRYVVLLILTLVICVILRNSLPLYLILFIGVIRILTIATSIIKA
jgi:hypothetical protein